MKTEKLVAKTEKTPMKTEKLVAKIEAMVYTTDLMAVVPSMTAFSDGKEASSAPLIKGPAGFLVAHFGNLVQSTEFPNVVLDTLARKAGLGDGAVKVARPKGRPRKSENVKKTKTPTEALGKKTPTKKTPTKALCKKTPTKALGKKTPTKALGKKTPTKALGKKSPEKEKQEKSRLFGVMYYKNNHFIGIRAKTGQKNQVLSFGGKAATSKTKDQMVEIGRKVSLFMDEGRSTEEAKEKASTMLAL